MARNDPQINIRMPQELKEKLEEAANKNNRSVTAEIIEAVTQSLTGSVKDTSALEDQLRAQSLALSYLEKAYSISSELIKEMKERHAAYVMAAGRHEATGRLIARSVLEHRENLPDELIVMLEYLAGYSFLQKPEVSDLLVNDPDFWGKYKKVLSGELQIDEPSAASETGG